MESSQIPEIRYKLCVSIIVSLLVGAGLHAQTPVARSAYADADVAPSPEPGSLFWREAPAVVFTNDAMGRLVPGHETEVRSRWTAKNLYFLFLCPYEKLSLRPNPATSVETNQLWNWDVAEVFVGADFANIRRYREFELSPQGEWVDLDIDLANPHHEQGWIWNSGFQVSARIDRGRKVWYGVMRIPYAAIDSRPARKGNQLRINFFRAQGPPPGRKQLAWQSTMSDSFHVPERFGLLELE